jgi:hypothetical protein
MEADERNVPGVRGSIACDVEVMVGRLAVAIEGQKRELQSEKLSDVGHTAKKGDGTKTMAGEQEG